MPETSILARCRSGESCAWRALFEQYVHSVYRWASCFGIDQANAEELTQEVFATAMKSIARCPCEAMVPAWLFQITRRHAANLRRNAWFARVLRLGGLSDLEASSHVVQAAASPGDVHELGFDLRRALRRMPAKLVEVLILGDLEGYGRDEIAQMLDIPPGTVASRLQKARKMLEEELG
jgi:RNA polymerase sigma-70 factor, ECF subfamily